MSNEVTGHPPSHCLLASLPHPVLQGSPEQGDDVLGRNIGLQVIGWSQDVASTLSQKPDAPLHLSHHILFGSRHGLFDINAAQERELVAVFPFDCCHIGGRQRLQRMKNVNARFQQSRDERGYCPVTVE